MSGLLVIWPARAMRQAGVLDDGLTIVAGKRIARHETGLQRAPHGRDATRPAGGQLPAMGQTLFMMRLRQSAKSMQPMLGFRPAMSSEPARAKQKQRLG
jgi:hypothetical protein